jgi:hypothetical protein
VLCPVCGRASGSRAFWERTKDFDPAKEFGIIQDVSGGRGRNFTLVGRFGPQDEPELFELVKARLTSAVNEWRAKGWLK